MPRHDTNEWVKHAAIALVLLLLVQAPLLASAPGAKGQTINDCQRSLRWRAADSSSTLTVNSGGFRQLGAKGQTFAMSERVRRSHDAASRSEASADRARGAFRLASITAAKPSENRLRVDPLRSVPFAGMPSSGVRSGAKSLFRRLAHGSPNSFGSPLPSLDSVAGRLKAKTGLDPFDRSFGATYTPQVSCASLLQRWAC